MAKMIMRLRGREPFEIDSPDSHEGYDLPDSVTSLGRWVGELITRITTRHQVLGQLQAHGWKSNDRTRALFQKLSDDVARCRAVPFSDISQDFYNWINLPGVEARLPGNTPEVIKSSPAAVIGQAMIDQEIRKASAEERFKHGHADLGESRQLPDLAQVPPPSTDAAKKFEQRLTEMGTLKLDAPAKTLRLQDQRSVKDGRKSTTEPSKPPGSTDPSL